MGANLSVQDTSNAHSSHHCHCHCHRCCGRKRRRETKHRGDAPLGQLILAAVDHIRAEMQVRGGRQEDDQRVRGKDREMRERERRERTDTIKKGKGSMKDGNEYGNGTRGRRREKNPRSQHETVDAQSQQHKTEPEEEQSWKQPSEQLQLHEDVHLTQQSAAIPTSIAQQESVQSIQPDPTPSSITQQSRRASRALDQAQANGMNPLPPPIRQQVNRNQTPIPVIASYNAPTSSFAHLTQGYHPPSSSPFVHHPQLQYRVPRPPPGLPLPVPADLSRIPQPFHHGVMGGTKGYHRPQPLNHQPLPRTPPNQTAEPEPFRSQPFHPRNVESEQLCLGTPCGRPFQPRLRPSFQTPAGAIGDPTQRNELHQRLEAVQRQQQRQHQLQGLAHNSEPDHSSPVESTGFPNDVLSRRALHQSQYNSHLGSGVIGGQPPRNRNRIGERSPQRKRDIQRRQNDNAVPSSLPNPLANGNVATDRMVNRNLSRLVTGNMLNGTANGIGNGNGYGYRYVNGSCSHLPNPNFGARNTNNSSFQ